MRRICLTWLTGACALLSLLTPSVPVVAQQPDRSYVVERPFTVEVLVNGYPLEEYPARGRLYIEALERAEYEIRISNPLPVRVAVALAVDGLNSIDARHTTARAASKWVIEPYSSITVGGWQMSSSRARRFYFTTERDSYAAKLGRAEDLGLISAVFFRARRPIVYAPPCCPRPLEENGQRRDEKERGAPPAAGSTRAESAGQARDRAATPSDNDDYAATGIGRAVENDVRWINLDLEERPAAEVAIRYEYRPALVRLGILPRLYPVPDPLQRRERARGFRDGQFCPEP